MLTFGQWLCDYSAEYGVAVHSWVFMTNHIHLLATPTDPDSIGLMMQALGRRYVRYFNSRHRAPAHCGKADIGPAWLIPTATFSNASAI
jgi:REP element-mobilizing transposase RayT